jgi:hypothetical protein
MPESNVNPPLFRRHVFEEEWLKPLRSPVAKGPLNYLLAVEGEHWTRIGTAVGYFAQVKDPPTAVLVPPNAEAATIAAWVSSLEPPLDIDASAFGQALELAREDLTADRRSFLELVLFASESDWTDAVDGLSFLRRALQRKEQVSMDILEDVSWALDGELSDGDDPMDSTQKHLPAGWRYGAMSVLRDCSARAAQRIDAVVEEREKISDALGEAFDPNAIDAEAIIACREAASRQDWARFDRLFRNHLMQGYHAYLSETLGAWEETLDLASLADDPSFPSDEISSPGYYPTTVARCLKHLGRSAESRSKYLDSLRAITHSHDQDTALYINNFLTLLIWRGELAGADQLAELNIRALSWIKDSWRYRWQVEHGCSSIAYLRMLQGRLDQASVLFDRAAHAWDGYVGNRPWIYDYYPYYRSELILLSDDTAHNEALAAIELLLEIAIEKRWPESICRGHIQAATIYADQASSLMDPEKLLLARDRLDQARRFTSGMDLPDVAIAYFLAELKINFAEREVRVLADVTIDSLSGTIDKLENLVSRSELALALSEVTAARGIQAYLEGSEKQARRSYQRALSASRHQGYALALNSPRSLVNWLASRVGNPEQSLPTGSRINLVELIGSDLSDDLMIRRLDALAPA